jgi:hypothetical protein
LAEKSLVRLADEKVPFTLAAQWAGVDIWDEVGERGVKVYCPFGEVEHPDGGLEPAMRVYSDHGWCFAESKYFSVTSLLAAVWEVTRAEAAAEALSRAHYTPASYAHLFTEAQASPEPDADALAATLVVWCESQCERQGGSWAAVSTSPAVARQLARCLGLLSLVRTEEDCETWLNASKQAMQRVLL